MDDTTSLPTATFVRRLAFALALAVALAAAFGLAACTASGDNFGGDDASRCEAGAHDGACVATCTPTACSGHGTCSDATGVPVCTCTGGFAGPTCATCADGMQDHDGNGVCSPVCSAIRCSGHGACSDASGTSRCACTGGFVGDDCATCGAGTQDNDHDGVCNAVCATASCSGHGACDDASGHVTCTCTGGYTGASCAACPAGMQDNEHDGMCATACSSATCSGHGTCLDTTGTALCTCTGSYTGADCSACPAGQQDRDHDGTCADACTSATCGAHGTCSDASGSTACTCVGGYVGATCGACATGTQDNDADGVCVASCTSGQCSGHGTCSDATGRARCVCAVGFTGASCASCAPGLQDNDHDGTCSAACTSVACGGHGACDDTSGAVACTCATGYVGASCSACGAGLQDNDHDGACTAACSSATCSGHGACDDTDGVPICTCTGNYAGASCTACDTGLQDHDHDGSCTRACTDSACSGHGSCSDASGTATCDCESGHGGVDCSGCGTGLQDHDGNGVCAPACAVDSCSGHGACSDATGAVACACTGGFAGATCATCATGLQDNDHDGACAAACTAATCSGHGTCVDSGGTATCTCAGGYTGIACDACATGTQDNDHDGRCALSCTSATCSGHGTCTDATGTAVCTCTGNYAGGTCASCATGLQDNDHDGVCSRACGTGTCSGHGTCVDTTGAAVCTCVSGYTGTTCDGCGAGLQDHDGDGRCAPACTATTCSGHGSCSDASGATACTCTGGYTGAACAACATGLQDNDHDGACAAVCTDATCSGHGTCSDASGTARCTCSDNHAGGDCAGCGPGYQDHDHDGVCAISCTATTCSGHGNCVDASGAIVCNCTANHAGTNCSACAAGFQDNDADGTCKPVCSDTTCSGHGACSDASGFATCTCTAAYRGASCTGCATGYQDNDGDGTCTLSCTATKCHGHGTCSDASGTASCTCSDRFDARYDCYVCEDGLQDEDGDGVCLDECTGVSFNVNGTSMSSVCWYGSCHDGTGVIVCGCSMGYTGPRCGSCATGYYDYSGTGWCDPTRCSTVSGCRGPATCRPPTSGGAPVCVCPAGHTAAECNACAAGYQDNDGDGTCQPACAPGTCNHHGSCTDASGHVTCATCDPGYYGLDCFFHL